MANGGLVGPSSWSCDAFVLLAGIEHLIEREYLERDKNQARKLSRTGSFSIRKAVGVQSSYTHASKPVVLHLPSMTVRVCSTNSQADVVADVVPDVP